MNAPVGNYNKKTMQIDIEFLEESIDTLDREKLESIVLSNNRPIHLSLKSFSTVKINTNDIDFVNPIYESEAFYASQYQQQQNKYPELSINRIKLNKRVSLVEVSIKELIRLQEAVLKFWSATESNINTLVNAIAEMKGDEAEMNKLLEKLEKDRKLIDSVKALSSNLYLSTHLAIYGNRQLENDFDAIFLLN